MRSAEGKGYYRRAVTSFAYFSLASANPEDTPALIKKATEEVEAIKKHTSNPGLAAQLNLQLERLRNEALPDLQLICSYAFPTLSRFVPSRWRSRHISTIIYGFLLIFPVTPDPERKYLSVTFILNHPLSRGTIVNFVFIPFVMILTPCYFSARPEQGPTGPPRNRSSLFRT